MKLKFLLPAFIISLCLMIFGNFFLFKYTAKSKKIPVYGTVADFQLQNSEGQTVGLNDLRGKVWVASFFFTTCGDICPIMNKNLEKLYTIFLKLDPGVRLVSITVNPDVDNPDVLKKYASQFKVDPKRWIFLTGDIDAIHKLSVESFKQGSIEEPVFHSSYFSLVDRYGHIRGFYDGTDPDRVQQLSEDIKDLLKER